MRRREYDEDDVRVRPARSSRPRTRQRPRHEDAVTGLVTEVHLGRYQCVVAPSGEAGGAADAGRAGATITAMRARELGRRSVVVGDRVALVGDVSGRPDTLARIVRVAERRSVLRRTPDDESGPAGRAVVANADQLVIVSSLVDPPLRTGFVDRCLVAAYDAEIDPLLCLTKADLVDEAETGGPLAAVRDYYGALDLPYVTCRPDRPLDALLDALRERISVLVGHSGVGKSTLVNRLVPEAERAVGKVSAVGKGRHTSSSAVALPLPTAADAGADIDPGWIIDTPGIRSFGLAHVSPDSLLHGFPDLVEASAGCPPGCDHHSPGCALDTWVAAGHADQRRLDSYRRLLASRAGGAA